MVDYDENLPPPQNIVYNVMKTTLLGAFSFLTALAIRDVVKAMFGLFLKDDKNLFVTIVYALITILCTVVLAYSWPDAKT